MGASQTLPGGLNVRELKYVKAMAKTGSGVEASKIAYPKNTQPDKNSYDLLRRPRVKKALIDTLEKQGITDDYLIDSLKRNLEAGLTKNANATSANKTLEMLVKLRTEQEKTRGGSVNLHLIQDMRNENNKNILEKRNKASSFFNSIIQDAELADTKPPQPPPPTT